MWPDLDLALANNMQTVNSNVNFSMVSGIIGALQGILRSQATMPNLETPYSRAGFPNPSHCAIEVDLDTIITERQQQLDTVLREISDLETVMDSIQNLRTVLWRLPTEVLRRIFVYSIPEDKYLSPASKLAPILLTRICRQWREVALGMPSLWCRLQLEVKHSDWQLRAFCYDSWLKRTLGHPLSLALRFHYHPGTPQVRSLIQPYIHQISSLDIDFKQVDHIDLSFQDFSALQDLTIFNGTIAIARRISPLPSTLSSLKFLGTSFELELLSSFAPVWAHLTTVEIYVYYHNAFLHLLQQCPNLSSLVTGIASYQIQDPEPFTHTKLQSLRLGGGWMFNNPLFDVFSALSLPNLRVLHVCSTSTWPHEEFMTFLARSKCPLESLSFDALVMLTVTEEQRAEYVALLPFLKVVIDHIR